MRNSLLPLVVNLKALPLTVSTFVLVVYFTGIRYKDRDTVILPCNKQSYLVVICVFFSCSDLPSDVSYYSVDLYNRNKRSKDVLVGMCESYAMFNLSISSVFFRLCSLGSIHTTSEEFKNGVFTLKTHEMFSFHTTNATITGRFGFAFEETVVTRMDT